MPADCVEKVVSSNSYEILYQRIPTPRPPSKNVLKEVWQAQHGKEQQRTGIEKSIAGQENPVNIDFRVQGVPQKAVPEDQDWASRTEPDPCLGRLPLKANIPKHDFTNTCSRIVLARNRTLLEVVLVLTQ